METEVASVYWKDVEALFNKLKEVIDAHFDFDIDLWSRQIKDWNASKGFWQATREETLEKYCGSVRGRLTKASNNYDVYFPGLSNDVLKDLSVVFQYLIDKITEENIRNGAMEYEVRDATVGLKEEKKERLSKKRIVKPASLGVPLIAKVKAKTREFAFERPKHPYPEQGTVLFLLDDKKQMVRAEVVLGSAVRDKQGHDLVILVTSGECIGAYSRYPTAILEFVSGMVRPNGWTVIKRLRNGVSTETSPVSEYAKTLLLAGGFYKVKSGKKTIKKPELVKLVEHLPVFTCPSKDELVPMDTARHLIMNENVVPSNNVKPKEQKDSEPVLPGSEGHDLTDYEGPTGPVGIPRIVAEPSPVGELTTVVPISEQSLLQRAEEKRQSLQADMAMLDEVVKRLPGIADMEKQLEQTKADLQALKIAHSKVVEEYAKTIRDLEFDITNTKGAAKRLGLI